VAGSNNVYSFGAGSIPAGVSVGQSVTVGSTTAYVQAIDATNGYLVLSASVGSGSGLAFSFNSTTNTSQDVLTDSGNFFSSSFILNGGSGTSNFAGSITNTGTASLSVQVVSGTLNVTGNQTQYKGATTVGGSSATSVSALNLSPTSASAVGGAAAFTGSTVSVAANTTDTSTLTIGSNVTLNAAQINVGYNGGSTGGIGTVNQSGIVNVGTLDMSNGYNGGGTATYALSGAAVLSVNSAVVATNNNGSAATISLSGTSQLNLDNNSSFTMSRFFAPVVTINIGSGTQMAFYSDAGSTLGGTGSFNFSGSSTFTLNLQGTLAVGGFIYTLGGLTGAAPEAIHMSGGTLEMTANSADFFNTEVGTPGTTIPDASDHVIIDIGTNGGTFNTLGHAVTLTDEAYYNSTTFLTFNTLQHDSSGASTDGGITYDDTAATPGTLTIQGSTSYNGPTTVSRGYLLQQGVPTATSAISIASGATYELNESANASITGVAFTGAGTLTKTGSGSLTMVSPTAGATSIGFSGGAVINVQAGSLIASDYQGAPSWASDLATLNIGANGTFDGHQADVYIDALTGSGIYEGGYFGPRKLDIGNNNGSGTFSGTIQSNGVGSGPGNVGVYKVGTGVETLTGTLNFAGYSNYGTQTIDVAGGTTLLPSTLTLSPASATVGSTGANIVVAPNATDVAVLNATAGTYMAASLSIGSLGTGTLSASGTAIFDVNGVTLAFTGPTSAGTNVMNISGAAQLNLLNGGSLTLGTFYGRQPDGWFGHLLQRRRVDSRRHRRPGGNRRGRRNLQPQRRIALSTPRHRRRRIARLQLQRWNAPDHRRQRRFLPNRRRHNNDRRQRRHDRYLRQFHHDQ
jgi:hypothetical protein